MRCVKPITLNTKFRKFPKGWDSCSPGYKKRWFESQALKAGKKVTVPCGKCAFCLTNRRSGWMFRIYQEMLSQEMPGYFLTLTYNEKYVNRVGPQGDQLSLRFRDVQLYLKRIRKAKYYAKYICVGEYGSDEFSSRPHYHMLIWTDAPVDFLESNWCVVRKDGAKFVLGHIKFGKLEMASAMYTLKYIIQPKQGMSDDDPREKTRAQFSKGLGLSYLDRRTCDFLTHNYDDPELFVMVQGRKVALPLYYKRKIFDKYQMRIAGWKLSLEQHKKDRLELKKLRGQGVRNARKYLLDLKLEQCRRIIKHTKFNLTL